MKITPQAEYYGLDRPRTAAAEVDPEFIDDLLRGPRLTAGLNRRDQEGAE